MTSTNVTKHTPNEGENSYLAMFKGLEHRVEHMFENMWHNPFHHEEKPAPFAISVFEDMPKLDIVDRKKEVVVKAELPGFTRKEIDVSVIGSQLIIKASTCHEDKVEKGDFLQQEICRSDIYRSLALPVEVEDGNIKQTFKNGVLKLRIPKRK